MDSHSFAAAARTRVLLVPIGNITKKIFAECVDVIRTALEVRLVDVTGTKSRVFNPQGFPQGRVIYDFQTALEGTEALFLQDFEPYRKTFVVIGVSNEEVTKDLMEQLRKAYKSVLVHAAIVFEREANTTVTETISETENVFHRTKTNIETIMCEVTRLFLQELSGYHHSYQHLTLRSPGSVGESDPAKFIQQKKRISSGAALSLSLSDPSLNKISLASSSERRQSRVKGRQLKILGNLYLLAGNYPAAMAQFHEAITLLKPSYDYLWLGSALEGIAISILLHTYVDAHFELTPVLGKILKQQQQILSTNGSIPPHLISQTPGASPRSSFSSFATTASVDNFTTLPTCDLIFQLMTKVLDYYERSRNDPEDYVPNLVYCDTIVRLLKFMTVLSLNSTELNQQVLENIIKGKKFKSIPTPNIASPTFERFNILKLSNRIFQIEFKKLNIVSQIKIYSSLSLIYQDLSFHRKQAFLLRSLLAALIPELSNNTIQTCNQLTSLFDSLLSIYGVNSAPESIIEDSFSIRWTKLHKSIIQLCISVCDRIGDFSSSFLLKSILLTRYLNSLTDNEQNALLDDLRKDVKNNPNLKLYYFDPFVIRGIRLNGSSNAPTKEIKPKTSRETGDPFIYNPYVKQLQAAEEHLLVQGELAELVLTLQNPFAFQLEIHDLKIPNFEILKKRFTLTPKKLQNIIIPIRALKSGNVHISSINLAILECEPQDFKIATSSKQQVVPKLKSLEKTIDEPVLLKYNKNLANNSIEKRTNVTSLEIKVINAQPSLQLLSQIGRIMLIEGSKTSLTFKLKNNSNVPINYLKYSSWDSTEAPLKAALEDKSLPMTEINEIEYFLVKNSIIVDTDLQIIEPFEEIYLNVTLFGKRGLDKLKFFIDYGHALESSDELYLRRLTIPLSISVANCIELASCDVVPLSCSEMLYPNFKNFNPIDAHDYSLFIIDLRNVWNKSITIEVTLFDYKSCEVIVPLETKRLVLPIKRFNLGRAKESSKIPSLLNRQYILPSISKAEDVFFKKIYWYRQKILENLKGSWKVDNELAGDIEFRGIRLSQKMLSFLTVDEISVEIELKDVKFTKTGIHHCISTDDFFTIIVKITNHSDRDIKGVLRNIPLSLTYGSVDKRWLYNGVLQRTISEPIKKGQSFEFQIGAVVLESGDYEFGALFDEYGSDEQYVSRHPLRIKVS